jgi:hypothetical protein
MVDPTTSGPRGEQMFTKTAAAVAAGLTTMAIGLIPSSASALGHDDQGSYSDAWSDQVDRCGRTWDRDFTASGVYQVDHTPAGAPDSNFHDNGTLRTHWVAADGSGDAWWIVAKANVRGQVEQRDPSTWLLKIQTTGRSWVLTSESGDVVWADSGISRDTLTFVDGEFDGIDHWEHGRHVWVNFQDVDGLGCDMVAQAVAAG